MHIEEIVQRFDRLLEEERAAIRALDTSQLDRTAEEKAKLADALRSANRDDLKREAASVKRLSMSLRRNAILLVHARDSLRDVLEAARPRMSKKV